MSIPSWNRDDQLLYLQQDIEKIILEIPDDDDYHQIKQHWVIGRRIQQERLRYKHLGGFDMGMQIQLGRKLFEKYGNHYNYESLRDYELFFNLHLNLFSPLQQSFLSWKCYEILLSVKDDEERQCLEKKVFDNGWNEENLLMYMKRLA